MYERKDGQESSPEEHHQGVQMYAWCLLDSNQMITVWLGGFCVLKCQLTWSLWRSWLQTHPWVSVRASSSGWTLGWWTSWKVSLQSETGKRDLMLEHVFRARCLKSICMSFPWSWGNPAMLKPDVDFTQKSATEQHPAKTVCNIPCLCMFNIRLYWSYTTVTLMSTWRQQLTV